MKNKFYTLFFAALFSAISIKGITQYANKTLSNLTSPTAVNIDFLPKNSNSYSLGSTSKPWSNLYLDGSLYLLSFRFIYASNAAANTVVGIGSGVSLTSGKHNSFFGDAAGNSNSTASDNSFFGQDAGFSTNTGSQNSFFGESAGFENAEGKSNSFFGKEAGVNNTAGSYNIFVGNQAGNLNTTGNKNTYVGYHAGNTGTTGSSNTVIGYGADITNASYSNATALGNYATVGGSNHVHIGNSSVTLIGGQVSWSTLSDARVKNNIQQNVPGLQFINLLKPVTYHFSLSKQENILGRKDSSNYSGKNDIEKIQFTGFIAQEVEAAAKKIGYDFSGVAVPKNNNDLYSLRYSDFVVPLVKAVQELSKMNDTKDSAINALKNNYDNKIEWLQNQINELKTMIVGKQSAVSDEQLTAISSASLSQNIPNPFSNSTTINYSIPQKVSLAKIIITDKNGNALKQINLSLNKSAVNIDAATLSSGAYQYSLYVDGKLIATKQMILSK